MDPRNKEKDITNKEQKMIKQAPGKKRITPILIPPMLVSDTVDVCDHFGIIFKCISPIRGSIIRVIVSATTWPEKLKQTPLRLDMINPDGSQSGLVLSLRRLAKPFDINETIQIGTRFSLVVPELPACSDYWISCLLVPTRCSLINKGVHNEGI